MRKVFCLLFIATAIYAKAQKSDYPIQGVNFTQVKLTDSFWLPRLKINHTVTIPASFERCDRTGRVKNFEMAASHSGKFCTIFPFDDTDIYKTIEGASYSLSLFPDKKLENYVDSLIRIIGRAQEPDGYLYTARTIDPAHPHSWAGAERWVNERQMSHELYNAGHLYEAAAAHYYATGKRTLLNIALKNADLVCSVFGPDKRHVAPGHEIVEMGLVKLYRITGRETYLKTAKYFIDERGHYNGYDSKSTNPFKNGAYWQDHKPVTEQDEAIGHAVRAGYLYSGMADIAALTGDTAFLHAIDRIWENMVSRKFYVQGGVGAVPDGERFGNNYELPNGTAYNETCAAIANVFWNYRMFLLHGDSRYIDVMEKSLYNGLISGIGLDGKSFFYTNAMEIRNSFSHPSMEAERSGWFDCSCCPTNLVRLLPSIPGYVYAMQDRRLFVNLFINSHSNFTVQGIPVTIEQQNNYPWDGDLRFVITPKSSSEFDLLVRIPGWARYEAVPSDLYAFSDGVKTAATIKVNGQNVAFTLEKGYAVLSRRWKRGDVVEVHLPMEIHKVIANENVKEDIGKVALQRGPIMYCAEWKDNDGKVSNLVVPADTQLSSEYVPGLLNGVTVLKAQVPAIEINKDGEGLTTRKKEFFAIPYYSWANRGKGEMMIWFPMNIKDMYLFSSANGDSGKSK